MRVTGLSSLTAARNNAAMSAAASNRLAQETSPYLLQHAHNPVDWYPWGEEALKRARELDRPIFLSIGYSACHWCHVMERESFENDDIAALMNAHFVNVKVDREERPDLDEIYMKAVQTLTGSGGWPMSVFLTPELEPFFGGTYFPPDDRYGRPGFPSLLRWVHELWQNDRERAVKQGRSLTENIRAEAGAAMDGEVAPDVLDRSLTALASSYDAQWGGFSPAPKFPHATDVRLMLRHWKRTGNDRTRDMVRYTLDRMAAGGMYDQLAGGFARYSTDEKWLIPHFEKMLYDNALLVPAYLDAFVITGAENYARVARETCDWMLNEMRTPEGALASSLDADSEGVEGKFYAWTPDELVDVLGAEHGAWAAAWYDVTPDGNFEGGTSALWHPRSDDEVAAELGIEVDTLREAMAAARGKLLATRAERVPPGKDDKVLAAWNGLAIGALAQAYQVLGEQRFLDAARDVARYLLGAMRQPDGRLFATARHGRAHLAAYLDDYAFTIHGLIDLYEADFDTHWIEEALELNEVLTDVFEDKDTGGYFTTASDHERLIARMKVPYDGALPAGSAVQVQNLMRLAELTGNPEHAARAERAIRSVGKVVGRHPRAFSQLLLSLDTLAVGPREIVLAGAIDDAELRAMLATVRQTYLPQRVVAHAGLDADADLLGVVADKQSQDGSARAFVCRNFTCGLPVSTAAELAEQLAR